MHKNMNSCTISMKYKFNSMDVLFMKYKEINKKSCQTQYLLLYFVFIFTLTRKHTSHL